MKILLLEFALFGIVVARGPKELVLVQDLNSDQDRRHLDAGLPSQLAFNLRRETGNVKLTLEENRRLNANAPVYEVTEGPQGESDIVKKESVPITDVRFYHDKANIGTFSVRCQLSADGPCKRVLTGNFFIGGRNFDIEPVSDRETGSERGTEFDTFGTAHFLFENEAPSEQVRSKMTRSLQIPDASVVRDTMKEINSSLEGDDDGGEEEIDLEDDLDNLSESNNKRQNKATVVSQAKEYAVEILIVLDSSIWEKYYDITKATKTLNRTDATELRLREHFSLIINGVSLRFESIEDEQISIFCTISGFLIYRNRDSTNPLPPGSEIMVNGKYWANIDDYIDKLGGNGVWINSLKMIKGLPATDHIMVFSAFELFSGPNNNPDDGPEGIAYSSGICGPYRVSLNEDEGFFMTTSVAAHELGHSLGAPHDGFDSAVSCEKPGNFIMSPYVAIFSEDEKYSINPWRFSECSVNAFKQLIFNYPKSTSCLTNPADEFAHEEYLEHASKLPGELHDADAQCELLEGEGSKLCEETDMKKICMVMKCLRADGSCVLYTAARGTECKGSNPDLTYWCIDGACVSEEEDISPTKKTCVDEGMYNMTCKELRGWFATLQEFCDSQYSKLCCETCSLLGHCADYGYFVFSCEEILSDYYYFAYKEFCEDFSDDCCATCSPESPLTTTVPTTTPKGTILFPCSGDIGYDGLSCAELTEIRGSLIKLCQYYTPECCETCAGRCQRNQKLRISAKVYSCEEALTEIFGSHINAFCRVYARQCCKYCT